MNRAELLRQLKQPKLLVDITAGAIAVLGFFGCFNTSPLVKNLSLSALIAGAGTLASNTAIARLYAECALNTLERELARRGRDLPLAQSQITDLTARLQQWEQFWQAEQQRIGELEAQLAQAQSALVASQSEGAQVTELRATIEGLHQQIKALTAQHERDRQRVYAALKTLEAEVKTTMTAAIRAYRDPLVHSIEEMARRRADLAPQLQQLSVKVQQITTGHLAYIADLSLQGRSVQAFMNEAIALLQQQFEELSALKVKYRNTLNTGDKLHYQSLLQKFQQELDRLNQQVEAFDRECIPRRHHEAILAEFQLQKNEVFHTLSQQTVALETELTGDTEQYIQKLIHQLELATREIAKLKEEIHHLRQPRNFTPATRDDLRMGNQIIEFFYLQGIVLDRAGTDYRKHEAVLYFHADRNPRLIAPSELNDQADKLPQILRCLNRPEFKFDAESGLMSVWVQLAQKPPVDAAAVLKTVGTPEDFLQYLSRHPISYRIIGDKGQGKTPLMAVMVAHLLKVGGRKGNGPNGMKMPKLLVGVSYPNADFSQKDRGDYPLDPFLFARNDEQCKQSIARMYQDYQRRRDPAMSVFVDEFFQVWVLDEADNTLDFSADGSASKMRSIFNDGGHVNIGWIFAGQSVNTRVLKGWTNDDRKKSTEIILEAAKIRAWAEDYGSDYYGSDRLKALLANVDAVREVLEQENAAIGDEAKRLRIALIADPISPKLFLLPPFDRVEFDLDAYLDIRREADGILAGLSSNAVQSLSPHVAQTPPPASPSTIPGNSVEFPLVGVCPDCRQPSSDRKGKLEGGKQRYFCKNPNCQRQTFTVTLVEQPP
jgi:hypothetical protein